ncbi:toprim domain-containing protein [bacterium]|nr:toprim domain-containing protein [bacterium]
MDALEKLAEQLTRLPGIGRRQARRIAFFLAAEPDSFVDEIARSISFIKKSVRMCESCRRYHDGRNKLCIICADPEKDTAILLILEKDVDLENVRKTGAYRGRYFVLGGLMPLSGNGNTKIRMRELLSEIEKQSKQGLKEVVIALSANPEGDNTARYVKNTLAPHVERLGLIISSLGRGLSTGTELEYSDEETLKSALSNRK